MKKLLALIVGLLQTALPSLAFAAFASIGSIGTANSTVSGSSLVITTGATLEAGNLGLCFMAKNNASTSDGNTNEVTSVTDSASNTYNKLWEYTYAEGAANAGGTIAVFYTIATSQLTSGGTITFNQSDARTSRAARCWEFTIAGTTTSITIAGTPQDQNINGTDAASATISGLDSKEYLFVRALAVERDAGSANTPTANYTNFTLALASTGADDTSMRFSGEFRILTGTGDTSDPSSFSAANADGASTYFALQEVAAATTRPIAPFIFQ